MHSMVTSKKPMTLQEQLKTVVFYNHLKMGCFVIRSNHSGLIAFYSRRVAAGMPSDVEDIVEQQLDLNEYLSQNSDSVFCIRVEGDSMIGAGIYNNDLLVVDRSVAAADGKIVIASVNSELTVKRFKVQNNRILLMPENSAYAPIVITEDIDL